MGSAGKSDGKSSCVGVKRSRKEGVLWLAVENKFVNSCSTSDAYVLSHLGDSRQKVGKCRRISNFDCRSGYSNLVSVKRTGTLLVLRTLAASMNFLGCYMG